MPSTDGAEWPLTGRDGEIDTIDVALRGGGGVLIAGPAGVGKTRLAREVLARHGGAARWVRASGSARTVPLGAFVPLLGWGGEGPEPASLLVRAHAALRAEPGALLGVDDAHQLDDLSATLLQQAAAEGSARMVVTLRTGEPAPAAVTALWKDGLLVRIDLSPLSAEETGGLVGAVLGGRLERDSASRLHHLTSGNPLWLRHLVQSERRAGRFEGAVGVWRWEGSPQLDPALTMLLDAQLGALPADVATVLELLAVGEPLDARILADLAGAGAVDEAAARGLVSVSVDGAGASARLAHPLYGEALLGAGGALRARRRRGQLVDALLEAEPDGGDVLRLAVLALDSDLPPDPKLLARGAKAAADFADLALAERLARAACDAGAGFETRLMLANLMAWQFRRTDADHQFALAAEEALTEADRVRLAFCRWIDLWIGEHTVEADAVVSDAARESPWARSNLLAVHAMQSAHLNRLAECSREARSVLDAPDRMIQAEAYAAWVSTAVAAVQGRLDDARTLSRVARDAAACSPETVSIDPNVRYWDVVGLALAGLPAELGEFVAESDAALTGTTFRAVFRPIFQGWHALTAGRVGEAAALLGEFRVHIPGHGGGWTCLLESVLGIARGMAGDGAGAAEAVRRAAEFRHFGVRVHEPLLALARAWASAADGAVDMAVREARQAASAAAESEQYAVEVLARQAAVGFGDRAQSPALERLARRVDGPRAPLAVAHARAWQRSDPAALLRAAEDLAAAGLLLPAAEAAAQAAVLAEPSDPIAGVATRRASELAARCPGARTPALVAAARPLSITAREREVATLAATLTNREIAERLGVSVRTVEGHVYRGCAKLGLPDRAALAAYVGAAPPG